MRDAFGGLLNIGIIVVFMTIVSGYLAFNVSYAKAFKVKNKLYQQLRIIMLNVILIILKMIVIKMYQNMSTQLVIKLI